MVRVPVSVNAHGNSFCSSPQAPSYWFKHGQWNVSILSLGATVQTFPPFLSACSPCTGKQSVWGGIKTLHSWAGVRLCWKPDQPNLFMTLLIWKWNNVARERNKLTEHSAQNAPGSPPSLLYLHIPSTHTSALLFRWLKREHRMSAGFRQDSFHNTKCIMLPVLSFSAYSLQISISFWLEYPCNGKNDF